MSFFSLDYQNEQAIQRLFAQAKSGYELEIRFGTFVYNQLTKQRRFESNVSCAFWFAVKSVFDKLHPSTHCHSTDYIYNVQGGGVLKKTVYADGTMHYTQKNQKKEHRDVFDYDFRVALSSETVVSEPTDGSMSKTPSVCRVKDRYTYTLPFGKLDMTRVKQDAILLYEIEMEIEAPYEYAIAKQFITVLLQIKQNNYYVISNRERSSVLREYKTLLQLQKPIFVGAQPETLQKQSINMLYKELYSVTDKADGERAFLYITSAGYVYFLDANLDRVYKTGIQCTEHSSTLLDGELLIINNAAHFFAFDTIVMHNSDMRGNTNALLHTRLDHARTVVHSLTQCMQDPNVAYHFCMKTFYFDNVFLGARLLMESTTPYEKDGLIFTPVNEPYPVKRKWNKLVKWKPAHLNTIDLYAIQQDEFTWNLYVQHVSPSSQPTTRAQPTLTLFDVDALQQSNEFDGTTCRTTIDPSLLDPTTNMPFQSHTVIEFKWDFDLSKFVPIKTRWDKTANPRKHGNFSSVACDIWHNIHNPIEADLLLRFTTFTKSASEDGYFEGMRRFHNKIKETLYNRYVRDCEMLLELCSGKGGDMHKWFHNNVKRVVGYDISQKSIDECTRRLATSKQVTGQYTFFQQDLCDPNAYQHVMHNVQDGARVISCQFGVHYFFKSQVSFMSLTNMLKHSLAQDGYFIVTYIDDAQLTAFMDGRMTQSHTTSRGEVVYYLAREPTHADTPYGQSLKVILSGNNVLTEGSDEYIIPHTTFVHDLESIGLQLVDTRLFKDIELDMKQVLTPHEQAISFLYRYAVFRKHSASEHMIMSTPVITTQAHLPLAFDTIDLLKRNMSLHKVSTVHDIIDTLNCIEYFCYKQSIEQKNVMTFEDIQHVFSVFGLQYIPVYVADPLNFTYNTPHAIYFTYHKHVVEKTVNEQCERTEYDNWYVILHKHKLLFTYSVPKPEQEQQVEQAPEPTSTPTIEPEQARPKMTIKMLKERLATYGLKVSGNKQELIERLNTYEATLNKLN